MLINSNKNMTLKKYQKIKIAVIIVMAMIFSQSIILRNFFIPVTALLVGVLVLLFFKKKVTEVLADERDYQTGGKSALLAIQIYSWFAVICMFLMYSLQDINPYYEAVAVTLAFSTCILMLLYAFIFRYYNKIKMTDKKLLFTISVLIFFVLMAILTLRVFSGEDSWMCKDGEWVKHGQPSYPAPQKECK